MSLDGLILNGLVAIGLGVGGAPLVHFAKFALQLKIENVLEESVQVLDLTFPAHEPHGVQVKASAVPGDLIKSG